MIFACTIVVIFFVCTGVVFIDTEVKRMTFWNKKKIKDRTLIFSSLNQNITLIFSNTNQNITADKKYKRGIFSFSGV